MSSRVYSSVLPAFALATLFATAAPPLLASPAAAFFAPTPIQGEYVNFEVGAVHPVTLQTFTDGGVTEQLLMVCNGGDHALEFYRTDGPTGAPAQLIKTVPTGLSPVTVRFDPITGYAYTCDHMGDSITRIEVTATENGGQLDYSILLDGTYPVGDEPTDIVIIPAGTVASSGGTIAPSVLLVSLRSMNAVARVNPTTMAVDPADERILLSVERTGTYKVGVNHPTAMARVQDDLYILDKQSDDALRPNLPEPNDHMGFPIEGPRTDDLDLFVASPDSPLVTPDPLSDDGTADRFQVGGLGTAHHHMVADQSGDKLFIVGIKALPSSEDDEAALRVLPTGFAQSWLWIVDVNPGSAPTVVQEWNNIGETFKSTNLNRDYNDVSTTVEFTPTTNRKALAHPTGVALYEPSGSVAKVVVTAFSSDRIGVLEPTSGIRGGWRVRTLDIGVLDPSRYSMAGPRGVEIDQGTGLAYVMCALDNTLRVIDITGTNPALVQSIALDGDHTPASVGLAREFLYGAHHSATGMVSCSTCHVDGHSDGLLWTLLPADDGPLPLKSFNFSTVIPSDTMPSIFQYFMNSNFPSDKGPMVTQSLRGLVNHPISGEAQSLATNAPYHWRGDRAGIANFNQTFPGLLGGDPLDETPGSELDQFTEFINGIMHAPNPLQAKDRRLTGTMGSPNSNTRAFDPSEGNGAMRGMKLFHGNSQVGLSCSHCHAMPEGSVNRLTQRMDNSPTDPVSPIEPAALRSIFDFEPIAIVEGELIGDEGNADIDQFVRVKTEGLFHDGNRDQFQSISHFIQHRFVSTMPGESVTAPNPSGGFDTIEWNRLDIGGTGSSTSSAHVEARRQTLDLTEFVRTLDSGTAPGIGWTYTLVGSPGPDNAELDFIIDQAGEANVGAVVHTRVGQVEKSYWYDVARGRFRRDSAVQPESRLKGYFRALAGAGHRVVLHGVPVGSARKIADREGLNQVDAGTPTSLALDPMAMPTHWEEAGELRAFWDDQNSMTFYPQTAGTSEPDLANVTPRNSHLMVLNLQNELLNLQQALGDAFDVGLSGAKHEPPRRFRVRGTRIQYGAKLILMLPNDTGPDVRMEIPIFATKYMVGNQRVWESAIEIDGEMQMALLAGGPYVDGVRDNLNLVGVTNGGPVAHPIDPVNDNDYEFRIQNPTGPEISGGTARLMIQDMR